jgi:hypothetical protein
LIESPRRGRIGERSANPERGREGWIEIARVAGIRNLQGRTSTMKLLPSPRDIADVFLPNTHSGERGEITFFLPLVLMTGAANGRKRRRETGAIVRAMETETVRASLLPGHIVRETPPRIWSRGAGVDHTGRYQSDRGEAGGHRRNGFSPAGLTCVNTPSGKPRFHPDKAGCLHGVSVRAVFPQKSD